MEEQNIPEQTYAYELALNSEELLKIRKEEMKELKKKVAKDREIRLANSAQKRAIRDDRIERITLRLKTIKEHMVKYNRAGKIEKDRTNILRIIYNLIDADVDLMEDIERTIPQTKVTDEEIKSEAFVNPTEI